ncbi:hypothetical protein Cni_G18114 [Canna indica]|uniref:DUF7734 domain-containing protein n=1 Tax=Canna indica TaxID=4628 RepID=A0AAQ3QH80_9LILI|nr:hypothetical protein Cni_G18114 [Canna indica]
MVIHSLLPQAHPACLPASISDVVHLHNLTPAAVLRSRREAVAAQRRLSTEHCQLQCKARRRVRYEEEEESEEEYGQNLELSLMEAYSERARNVALLVRATVDGEEELVLVFRGFSSSLSSMTSSDPWKSVLPARAVIESIDVVKGPFDPSNIDYLERDLTWEAFKTRLQSIA